MPFHVRIVINGSIFGESQFFGLDKSHAWIEQGLAQPRQRGEDLFMDGKVFRWPDILDICIYETEKTTAEHLRDFVHVHGGKPHVSTTTSLESIAISGADVTDDFLAGPPGSGRPSLNSAETASPVTDSKVVMVICGHDDPASTAMFGWLRSIGLKPREFAHIIQASGSAAPNIWDAVRAAFDTAQAVIVLFTPDEYVGSRTEITSGNPGWRMQASPNVILQAGAALVTHADRTVLVTLGAQEIPSGLAGRHHVQLSHADPRPLRDLANLLQNAGCDIDLNGSDWLDPRRFPALDHPQGLWQDVLHAARQPLPPTFPEHAPDHASSPSSTTGNTQPASASSRASVTASALAVERTLRERLDANPAGTDTALSLPQLANRAHQLALIDAKLADSLHGFSVMCLLASENHDELDSQKASHISNLAAALQYLLKPH